MEKIFVEGPGDAKNHKLAISVQTFRRAAFMTLVMKSRLMISSRSFHGRDRSEIKANLCRRKYAEIQNAIAGSEIKYLLNLGKKLVIVSDCSFRFFIYIKDHPNKN